MLKLPEAISSMTLMDYRPRGFRGVLVALKNKEVRLYKDKFLINTLVLDVSQPSRVFSESHQCQCPCPAVQDVVVGLKFGRFGREEGALLMVTQGGALAIKILKRTANLDPKESKPGLETMDGHSLLGIALSGCIV